VTMLTADQVADLANVPKKTIQRWATEWDQKQVGPKPHRLGERITRYRLDEVADWLGAEPAQLTVPAA
jgi:predicted DNA-binding transcriptional regulator AlpA